MLNHKRRRQKLKRKKTMPPVALGKDGMYVCLICERGGDKVGMLWYPKEIPRHLEKAHGFPKEAHLLRMQLIPDWNENFERDYCEYLYNEIKFEKPDQLEDIAIDSTSTKFKKEEKERRQRELEAARESD
jgi:hypothetical protein